LEDDNYIYKLVGVNIHVGTADHGHYYSLINTNRGVAEVDPILKEADWLNVEKDNWRVFNDDEVKFFSFKDMAAEAFGGSESAVTKDEVQNFLQSSGNSYGKSAYMLVYERKKKKSVR
jgi:ubiquitin carboxyl-terminal hydrolase 9/24